MLQLADLVGIAAAHGLRCTDAIDATAATAPSHALSFDGIDLEVPSEWSEVLAAEQLFSWLHERGLVECHYVTFAADPTAR